MDLLQWVTCITLGLGVGAAIAQIFGGHKRPSDPMAVTKDICIVKHAEMDRHMNSLKENMNAGFERLDHSIERLYDKLEQASPTTLGQTARKKGTA